eukprot:16116_1
MPADLSKYFILLLSIQKSSTWPVDLRKEYVNLFGLDSISSRCKMKATQSAAQDTDVQDLQEDGLNDEYVPNDDIEHATDYLEVMNASIEYKQNQDEDEDEDVSNDVDMSVMDPHFSEEHILDENVNVVEPNEMNRRRRCWRQYSGRNDIDCEPVKKKRRLAKIVTCTASVNLIDGHIPTTETLNRLKTDILRTQHLAPHNLLLGGAKYVKIMRIMQHYKKEHDDDVLDDGAVVDDSLNQCVRAADVGAKHCLCGSVLSHLKVRNVYINRNYVDCDGQCQKRITNGREMVFHCSNCKRCMCEVCFGQ